MRITLISLVMCSAIFCGCRNLVYTRSMPIEASKPGCVNTYYLPMIYSQIKITRDKQSNLDTLVLQQLPAIADKRQAYELVPNHNMLATDKFTIKTSKEGLLEAVNINSNDNVPEIVLDIANMFLIAANPSATLGTLPTGLVKAFDRSLEYVDIFDPSDPDSITALNNRLAQCGYKVHVTSLCPTMGSELEPHKLTAKYPGIVYRRPLTYNIEVYALDRDDGEQLVRQEQHSCPNRGPLVVTPLKGGPFVETKYDLTFTTGMMTKYEADHPSEIRGATEAALAVFKIIARIPGEALTSKDEMIKAEAAYMRSQADYLKAQGELAESIATANEKQRSSSESAALNNSPGINMRRAQNSSGLENPNASSEDTESNIELRRGNDNTER